jgi:TonB-linked SusC/RagA family outer membrane protein
MNNFFVITVPKKISFLLFFVLIISSAFSQKVITGRIIDANNDVLAGTSIVIKGTNTGTFADEKGEYKITVPDNNSVLQFTFLGYKSKSVTVGDRSKIDITLEEEIKELTEAVVVGYGVQKKINLTGAVSQISGKELLTAPAQNITNMLAGKIPGLTAIQRTGKPGADQATVYVRGLNTFSGSNSPMMVVDGVPRVSLYINPNDVESISVLKDASASVYGVQGANGVILITTKSGSEGPAKISYDGSASITQNTAMPEFLNAADYMYWHNKAREMDGLAPLWTADIQQKVMKGDPDGVWGQTNWMDMIFQTSLMQQHNISASGGTQKVKYFASIGIMDQDGTLINTHFTRYNLRTNLDIQIAKNLRFISGIAANRTDRNWPGYDISDQGEFNPVRQAITAIPIIKSEYEGYPMAWVSNVYANNAYAALTESGFKRQNSWRADTNFKLEYDFSDLTDYLKGLKISVFAAYNYSNTTDANFDRYFELYTVNNTLDYKVVGASGYSEGSGFSKSASWGDSWLLRPMIEYSRTFREKHYISTSLLYEASKYFSSTMTGTNRGYYSDDPVDISMGTGTTLTEKNVSGSYVYTGQAAYIGRLNYAFESKYLAEFAFRHDGSYVFAPESRWGFFPSFSLGYVISQEDFFQNSISAIDYLKLRASYGQAGSDSVDPFLYNSNFGISQNSMVLGDKALAQFYTINPYVYRNLTWATTDTYNAGLEIDVWNRKLNLEVDVFYKLTRDILESQGGTYPPSLASYYPSYKNSGKVENKGFEIILKHENKISRDFRYNLSGTFSFARNKVVSRVLTDSYPSYRAILGQSMNARYGFEYIGLFQTQEEIDQYPTAPSGQIRLGDLKYRDVNGDGIISSTYDYVKTGYGDVPEISFSSNWEASYRNFYINLLWQGVTHTDYELSGVYSTGVTSSTPYTSTFAEGGNTPYYLVENAWTPEHTNAEYPRLSTVSNGNNAWRSTRWVVNGEYIRLKTANFGFNVPKRALNKTPFSDVNIYIAGTNLLTFSHFKYVDPESPSVSRGYYPQQKTYSLGLNVTF